MRTRREFKRTIAILTVLLIISAALNVALMVSVIKLKNDVERLEQPSDTPDITPADAETSETPLPPETAEGTSATPEVTPDATPTNKPTPVPTPAATPVPTPTPTPVVTHTPTQTPKASPKTTKRPRETIEPTPTANGWVYSSFVPQNTETPVAETPNITDTEPTADALGDPFGGN